MIVFHRRPDHGPGLSTGGWLGFDTVGHRLGPGDSVKVGMIIKLLEGTQGVGVVLAETTNAAEGIINAFKSLKAKIGRAHV